MVASQLAVRGDHPVSQQGNGQRTIESVGLSKIQAHKNGEIGIAG